MKTKVAIIEDELIMCDIVRRVCEAEFGLDVVAVAHGIKDGGQAVRRLLPDLLIVDLLLRDGNAVDLVQELASETPAKVLVLSAHLCAYALSRLRTSRVDALVDKGTSTVQQLREAIACLLSGGTYVSAQLQAAMVKSLFDRRSFFHVLTVREMDVLRLVGLGQSDKEIGRQLGISCNTIRVHRSHILGKLGIETPAKLVAFAATSVVMGSTRQPDA